MSTLRDGLQEIVWAIDSKFDDNRPSCDSNFYINQILQLIATSLPEKKPDSLKFPINRRYHADGWNDYRDEALKLLGGGDNG